MEEQGRGEKVGDGMGREGRTMPALFFLPLQALVATDFEPRREAQ